MPKPDPTENETDGKKEEEDGQRESKRENFKTLEIKLSLNGFSLVH